MKTNDRIVTTASRGSASVTKGRRNNAGFTLVEIMIYLVIAGLVLGGSIVAGLKLIQSGRVNKTAQIVSQAEALVTAYLGDKSNGGFIPVTEGAAGAGMTRVALAAAPSVAVAATQADSDGCTLDQVFLAAGIATKSFSVPVGDGLSTPTGTTNYFWNTTTRMLIRPAASPTSYAALARLESRVSNTAMVSTAPDGSNFYLDGNTGAGGGIAANRTVCYAVIPSVQIGDAVLLSKQLNEGLHSSTAATLGQPVGKCSFAAPTGTTTTVFVYLGDV